MSIDKKDTSLEGIENSIAQTLSGSTKSLVNEDIISTGPILSESNLFGENPCDPNLTLFNDEVDLESQKEMTTNIGHGLSELMRNDGNPTSPEVTKDKLEKLLQYEAFDKIDIMNKETFIEKDTSIYNEVADKQENPTDLNILIDTRRNDLGPNTDLLAGDNRLLEEKNDNLFAEVENSEEFKVLEEEILQAHDKIAEEKVEDLFLQDKGDENGKDIQGYLDIPAENVVKEMKDNKECSDSLLDFTEEEFKSQNNDTNKGGLRRNRVNPSPKDEVKKVEKSEDEDTMNSVTVETIQEQDTLKIFEEANKLEAFYDPNIDLVSNTDLANGDNSLLIEKIDDHIMEFENSEESNVLEEEILKAHDETVHNKTNDQIGYELTENLENQRKDNEESSASLFDFGVEEPKTEINDIKETYAVDNSGHHFLPHGIERINDLLFLETVNDQNVIKSKDPVVETTL